jgi:hypothetical protein
MAVNFNLKLQTQDDFKAAFQEYFEDVKYFGISGVLWALKLCQGSVDNFVASVDSLGQPVKTWRNDLKACYDAMRQFADQKHLYRRDELIQNEPARIFIRQAYREIVKDVKTSFQSWRGSTSAETVPPLDYKIYGAPGIGKSTLVSVLLSLLPSMYDVKTSGILLLRYTKEPKSDEQAKSNTSLPKIVAYAFWRIGTKDAMCLRGTFNKNVKGSQIAEKEMFENWIVLVDGFQTPKDFGRCESKHVIMTCSSGAYHKPSDDVPDTQKSYILPAWTQGEALNWQMAIFDEVVGAHGYPIGEGEEQGRYPKSMAAFDMYAEDRKLLVKKEEERLERGEAAATTAEPQVIKFSDKQLTEMKITDAAKREVLLDKDGKVKAEAWVKRALLASQETSKKDLTRFLNMTIPTLVEWFGNVGGSMRLITDEHAFMKCLDIKTSDEDVQTWIKTTSVEEIQAGLSLPALPQPALSTYRTTIQAWANNYSPDKVQQIQMKNLENCHHVWHQYCEPVAGRVCPPVSPSTGAQVRFASDKIGLMFRSIFADNADSFIAQLTQQATGFLSNTGESWERTMDFFFTFAQCGFKLERLPLPSTPVAYNNCRQFAFYTDAPYKYIVHDSSVPQLDFVWLARNLADDKLAVSSARDNPLHVLDLKQLPLHMYMQGDIDRQLRGLDALPDHSGGMTAETRKLQAELNKRLGTPPRSDSEDDSTSDDDATPADVQHFKKNAPNRKSRAREVFDTITGKRKTALKLRQEESAKEKEEEAKRQAEIIRSRGLLTGEARQSRAHELMQGWSYSMGVFLQNHAEYYPFVENVYVKLVAGHQSIDSYKLVIRPAGSDQKDELWLYQMTKAESHSLAAHGIQKILQGLQFDLNGRKGGCVKRRKPEAAAANADTDPWTYEKFNMEERLIGNIHVFFVVPSYKMVEQTFKFSELGRKVNTGYVLPYADTHFGPHPACHELVTSCKPDHPKEIEVKWQLWNVQTWLMVVMDLSRWKENIFRRLNMMKVDQIATERLHEAILNEMRAGNDIIEFPKEDAEALKNKLSDKERTKQKAINANVQFRDSRIPVKSIPKRTEQPSNGLLAVSAKGFRRMYDLTTLWKEKKLKTKVTKDASFYDDVVPRFMPLDKPQGEINWALTRFKKEPTEQQVQAERKQRDRDRMDVRKERKTNPPPLPTPMDIDDEPKPKKRKGGRKKKTSVGTQYFTDGSEDEKITAPGKKRSADAALSASGPQTPNRAQSSEKVQKKKSKQSRESSKQSSRISSRNSSKTSLVANVIQDVVSQPVMAAAPGGIRKRLSQLASQQNQN